MQSGLAEGSAPRRAGASSDRMTGFGRVLLLVVAVLLAFALGAGWQYLRANRAEQTLGDARRELIFTRLEATLGAAAIEAQRGNHEIARQLTSDFFTGLQNDLGRAPAAGQDALRTTLTRRDAVITMLSRGDPEAASVLTRMFVQYRLTLRGPESATPMAAPAAGTGAVSEEPPRR